MASAVVFRWLEELDSLTKSLLSMLHLSGRRKASYDRLFPHGGVARLLLAISRAVPHPDERSAVSEEHKETKHKEMFKRLPEG